MRFLYQDRTVARRRKRPHESAEPHRQVAGDHAQLTRATPTPLALRQQCLMRRQPEDATPQGQSREISRREAAAHRGTEQHDAPWRQNCTVR